jgi:ribonuclease HI
MQLHKDRRAISRGNPTNAVIAALNRNPHQNQRDPPKRQPRKCNLSGTVGNANMKIFTDGSTTENHVGASMVAEKDSKEIHINTQKLNTTCTVFQAELYGIRMAIEWIQNQEKKTYAINVNSKAALLAIANKQTTHPLAVAIRVKAIKLRNSNSITFHWVKGHAGLKGNERADYLAKTVDTYNTTIAYDQITINRGKQILEDHYTKIWNAIYENSANASHAKLYLPTNFHGLSLPLWPNFLLSS